jgi:hypothetical protein
VNTLRIWWNTCGRHTYPDADRLLITADSGGANGNRRRTWKTELAALAECCSTGTAPTRGTRASRSGKIPTTSVRVSDTCSRGRGAPGHPAAVKLAPSRAVREVAGRGAIDA